MMPVTYCPWKSLLPILNLIFYIGRVTPWVCSLLKGPMTCCHVVLLIRFMTQMFSRSCGIFPFLLIGRLFLIGFSLGLIWPIEMLIWTTVVTNTLTTFSTKTISLGNVLWLLLSGSKILFWFLPFHMIRILKLTGSLTISCIFKVRMVFLALEWFH